MPLKTYLPDGDIDLTALCTPDVEETLARDVLAVLQREEQNANAEYEVKDTQFIDAEVFSSDVLRQSLGFTCLQYSGKFGSVFLLEFIGISYHATGLGTNLIF